MSEDLFAPPPIPVSLSQFRTIGGLVVPFTTLQHRNGKAALGLVDANHIELCLRERRCGVCGQIVSDRLVFLLRGVDLARGCSNEPGLCPPCAAYTERACPMVGGHMTYYRQKVSSFVLRKCEDDQCLCRLWEPPEESSVRPGSRAECWFALWTLRYDLIRDPEGKLAAGFASRRVLKLRKIGRYL